MLEVSIVFGLMRGLSTHRLGGSLRKIS